MGGAFNAVFNADAIRIVLPTARTPAALMAAAIAARAAGRGLPLHLGPPGSAGDGAAAPLHLIASETRTVRVEINSGPFCRLLYAAAGRSTPQAPLGVALRYLPATNACHIWLARAQDVTSAASATGGALEAAALPPGVPQLAEADLAAAAAVPKSARPGVWSAREAEFIVGKLGAASTSARGIEVPPAAVATGVAALLAGAPGCRAPVRFLGDEQPRQSLEAALRPDGSLEVASPPLARLLRAAQEVAVTSGVRGALQIVLHAAPGTDHLRLWLAPARGDSLPVAQLSAAALAAEAAAASGLPPAERERRAAEPGAQRPIKSVRAASSWALLDADTVACGLEAALADRHHASQMGRLRLPKALLPPALAAAAAENLAAAGAGPSLVKGAAMPWLPVFLGPPSSPAAGISQMQVRLQKDGRTQLLSSPLLRCLERVNTASAGGPPLALVLRAEPAARRCRLWIAPAGAVGGALDAPSLPPGVQQLSEATLVW